MNEAPLAAGAAGTTRADGPGWFVLHVDEVEHRAIPGHAYTRLAGGGNAPRWSQFGMGIDVLDPGVANAKYHTESHDDESFLVLDGTCDLVIAGELHRLDAGTFVHCPAGVAHVFVGSGDQPCRILMFGNRGDAPDWGEYLPDPVAAELGASVVERTRDSSVAYADVPEYALAAAPTAFRIDRGPRRLRSTHGTGANGSARLESVDGAHGVVPVSPGWFIQHVDDSMWLDNGRVATLPFGGRVEQEFQQYGMNLRVLAPGAPACAYHREPYFDEVFLVLDGEAILIVEGEERTVRAGDLFWCPAGTAHVFVGAGDAPCVLWLAGHRDEERERRDPTCLEYPVEPAAARFSASVMRATNDPDVAYADWPESRPAAAPPWQWRREPGDSTQVNGQGEAGDAASGLISGIALVRWVFLLCSLLFVTVMWGRFVLGGLGQRGSYETDALLLLLAMVGACGYFTWTFWRTFR